MNERKAWAATQDNAILALAAAEEMGIPKEAIGTSDGSVLQVVRPIGFDDDKKLVALEEAIDTSINKPRQTAAKKG